MLLETKMSKTIEGKEQRILRESLNRLTQITSERDVFPVTRPIPLHADGVHCLFSGHRIYTVVPVPQNSVEFLLLCCSVSAESSRAVLVNRSKDYFSTQVVGPQDSMLAGSVWHVFQDAKDPNEYTVVDLLAANNKTLTGYGYPHRLMVAGEILKLWQLAYDKHKTGIKLKLTKYSRFPNWPTVEGNYSWLLRPHCNSDMILTDTPDAAGALDKYRYGRSKSRHFGFFVLRDRWTVDLRVALVKIDEMDFVRLTSRDNIIMDNIYASRWPVQQLKLPQQTDKNLVVEFSIGYGRANNRLILMYTPVRYRTDGHVDSSHRATRLSKHLQTGTLDSRSLRDIVDLVHGRREITPEIKKILGSMMSIK